MGESRGYRVVPFGHNRQMAAASVSVNREKDTIRLITEVDITEPRRLISEHRDRTTERLSLTGYVAAYLSLRLNEFPQFNSFRKGRRLIVFDSRFTPITQQSVLTIELAQFSKGLTMQTLALTNENVEKVLDELRPYLMSDGGNVELVEVEGPVVKLRLQGACGSCPSSAMTLRMGIERRLREFIPESAEIQQGL